MRARYALVVLVAAVAASLVVVPTAAADFNHASCTYWAIGPNTGFDGNMRWGEGRARITCSTTGWRTYEICTQKKSSVFVLQESCAWQSRYIYAGQAITVTGPRLRDGFPVCYGVNWASRIKAAGNSDTSASYC